MDVRDHGDAHHPSAVCSVDEATGIFFTGGDQRDIVERLKRTPVGRAIRRAHLQGKAIGGTSAGAAALSDVMIADGARSLDANGRTLYQGPGLALLPGVIVDQHFSERRRLARLVESVSQHPDFVGLGVDEDTAAIVRGKDVYVMGSGSVTLVTTTRPRHGKNLQSPQVMIQIATSGDRFRIGSVDPALLIRRPETSGIRACNAQLPGLN